MGIDGQFIAELIEAHDPLAVVWRQMERIYAQTSEVSGDLRGLMDDQESALNELERAVYQGFFEVYDLLLERAIAQDESYVLSLFDECPFVIIADSLSVREAVLLEQRPPRFWKPRRSEWGVKREDFAVAPFPPTTESLSSLLLGVPGPASGRDRPQFTYRYVAGPEHIPAMPHSGSLLVWMRLPDTALEEVTVAQAHTVADAFQSTVSPNDRCTAHGGLSFVECLVPVLRIWRR